MALLTFEGSDLVITPESLAIAPFKLVWQRDKSKTKAAAIAELSYVYYMADFKSIYKNIPEEEREKKVTLDLFEGKKWKADKEIKKAIDKYKELNFSQTMGLLEDAKGAVEKLRTYFREVDLMMTDNSGKLLYTAKDLMANLKNLGEVVAGMKKLEEEVSKEVSNTSTIKGGNAVGAFEDADDSVDTEEEDEDV